MGFFFIIAYLLMKEGLPSRFLAILVFAVFEEGLTAVGQVYVVQNGSTLTQNTLFLPLAVSQFLGTFWSFMAYIAVANVFHYLGRDLIGRKKNPAPPPLARA